MTDTVRVPRCMVVKLHRFLAALCDGSPLHVPGSRFLLTDNPAFTEDNGEDPRILIDVQDWMLAASPQEAVPTKREAALADLAKLDGETMDLAASPQGEDDWITHDGGPNPVPGAMVICSYGDGSCDNEPWPSEDVAWEWEPGKSGPLFEAYRVTEGVKP